MKFLNFLHNSGSRSKLLSSSDTRTVQMLDSEEAAHFAKKRRRSVARQVSNVDAALENDSQEETIEYTIDRDGNFQDANFEQQQSHVQNQQQMVHDNSQEENIRAIQNANALDKENHDRLLRFLQGEYKPQMQEEIRIALNHDPNNVNVVIETFFLLQPDGSMKLYNRSHHS